MNSFEEMVGIVATQLTKSTAEQRDEFLKCDRNHLMVYHSTLGRHIRNEFKLWETEWIPQLIGGFDYSPNHPDNLSMRAIEAVWDKLRSEINENI